MIALAYLDIDRRRFAYLLSLGAYEFELRRFFTKNRMTLIQHGGRVQNLPHGQKAMIRTLASELPETTDGDVRSWFGEHLTMIEPEEPAKIVEEFTLYEEHGELMPEDRARQLARSCLVHLFGKSPPSMLVNFLRSTIRHPTILKEEPEDSVHENEVGSQPPVISNLPPVLSKLLINLLEGQDVDEDVADLPPEFGTFILALQAGQLGRGEEAHEMAAALPEGSALRQSLEAFLKRLDSARRENVAPVRGLRTQEAQTFSGEFSPEVDEVLGYCTSADRSSAVFVKPLAIVRPGLILFLSEDDARRIFPDTGALMAFLGKGLPPQPSRGEIGVWPVAEHDTEKQTQTRFHLASEKRFVYEVRMVPFPSTDPDSVRGYLKDVAGRSGLSMLNPYVYQLSDGLIIAPRTDRADLTKDEGFEQGLRAWNSLPALRLDGRLLVIGPFPKEGFIYECGSLASTVKSLFRNKAGIGTAAGLTKTQLRDLTRSIADAEGSLTGQRIERISAELVRLADQPEALEILVEQVSQRPEVRLRIDQAVELEVAKKLSVRTELEGEIARLQKERAAWEDRVRKQRDEHKKLRDETTKVVRGAFDRALNEGVPNLLAEVAIFQTLIPNAAPAVAPTSVTSLGSLRPLQRELVGTREDPVAALRKFGILKQPATAFVTLAKAVHGAGLMLTVTGSVARPAVEAWAAALGARGVLLDVSVGLIDDEALRKLVVRSPVPDVIVLFDANLSALDIYGRPLTDLAIANIAQSVNSAFPITFLVLSEGVGALPVPRTFEQLSVAIDLERRYEFQATSHFEGMALETGAEAEHRSMSRLWECGARRLAEEIDKLPGEDRALALSVLLA